MVDIEATLGIKKCFAQIFFKADLIFIRWKILLNWQKVEVECNEIKEFPLKFY